MRLVNAIQVENDFEYLGVKFKKGDIIEQVDKNTIVLVVFDSRKNSSHTPINLNSYSDPFRNDYYDSVRFVCDNFKNISLIRFRK